MAFVVYPTRSDLGDFRLSLRTDEIIIVFYVYRLREMAVLTNTGNDNFPTLKKHLINFFRFAAERQRQTKCPPVASPFKKG